MEREGEKAGAPLARGLKWTALGLAVACGLFWMLFGILCEWPHPAGMLIHALFPGLVFLAAGVLAWRWPVFGGLLLIGLGIHSVFFFHTWRLMFTFFTVSTPPIAAGCLFLAAYFMGRDTVAAE